MSSQGGGKQHSASQHRHRTDSTGESPSSAAAPNVRHIPIYVEGRDEPLINRNIDIGASAPASNHQPHHHSVHRSASASAGAAPTTSNFEWARKFPTMGAQASYEQQSPPVPVPQPPQPQQPHSQPQRSNSPIRTSGSSPNAGGTNGSPQQPQTYQQQPQPYQQQPQPYQPADVPLQQSPQSTSNQQTTSAKQRNNNNRRNNGGGGNSNSPSPANGAPIETAADLATIKKIQVIQVDMLELMDQVGLNILRFIFVDILLQVIGLLFLTTRNNASL